MSTPLRFDYRELVATKTALVVLDLQNYFVAPDGGNPVPGALEGIPRVNRLTAAVREAGGTVVWTRFIVRDQEKSWSVFFDAIGNPSGVDELGKANDQSALHPDLDVRPDDIVIDKHRFSAFLPQSCDLDARLRDRGIDTVIIAGAVTNICCESSARDAMQLDYRIVFGSDVNFATTEDEQQATLVSLGAMFADIVDADAIAARLAANPA